MKEESPLTFFRTKVNSRRVWLDPRSVFRSCHVARQKASNAPNCRPAFSSERVSEKQDCHKKWKEEKKNILVHRYSIYLYIYIFENRWLRTNRVTVVLSFQTKSQKVSFSNSSHFSPSTKQSNCWNLPLKSTAKLDDLHQIQVVAAVVIIISTLHVVPVQTSLWCVCACVCSTPMAAVWTLVLFYFLNRWVGARCTA